MSESVVIHWFRRDLRLNDNWALHEALKSGANVIPVFVFDPAILRISQAGPPRIALMLKALRSLDEALRRQGSALLVRQGDPCRVLVKLARETQASAFYFNRDYTPYARSRDRELVEAFDIPVYGYDDGVLRLPHDVMKPTGEPYTVYTPYKKRWRSLPPPMRPFEHVTPVERRWHPLPGLEDASIPTLDELGFGRTIAVPDASEAKAQARLRAFMQDAVYRYDETRNDLICDPFVNAESMSSSCLSPFLRFGLLSMRQVYWAAQEALDNAAGDPVTQWSVPTWIDQLIWREFHTAILFHFPNVLRANFRPGYDGLTWRESPADLQAWQDGLTGYPVVDAAMRQLKHTGWMPNRARMIVASFLTKDLLINWQEGERYFMQWLIDGDPAANNGGWQWVAGTGTDAQPYFRIFNPVAQSRKFDPEGHYIRYWVPELRGTAAPHIHAPWEMDTPPRDYPPPVVDHAFARERTLAAFRAIRG
jgi:deoxyribodipyrimidine photo-lyase